MKKRCCECKELKNISKFRKKKGINDNPIKERFNACNECYHHLTSRKPKQKATKITKRIETTEQRLTRFSKDLKKKQTVSEGIFEQALIKEKIAYKSQYPIFDRHHRYIVDFLISVYNGSKGIVVEIDGGYHQTEEMILKDKNRDDYLHLRGFVVMRFTNDQIPSRIKDIITLLDNYDIKRLDFDIDLKKESHTIILK